MINNDNYNTDTKTTLFKVIQEYTVSRLREVIVPLVAQNQNTHFSGYRTLRRTQGPFDLANRLEG